MTDLREQTGAAQPHRSNGEVVPGGGTGAGGAGGAGGAAAGDEQKTIALVGELNDLVMSGKYDQAYDLMGDKFKERVKPQDWQQRWQRFRDVQKLTKIESNRRVDFETQPNTGEILARSFVIP